MKRVLRSYIEPGSPREAIRRAQWTALGISDEDMLKPKIAVVNSSSELAICFSHLDGIAKMVKESIRAAGGLPFEVRTAAPSDFIIGAGAGGGYILASRDLIVNDMEIAIEGARLDGMICLSSCDKTPPAHLMAAGRFNIPSILVICGYQPSGRYAGKHVDIEDLFLGTIQASLGKLTRETLKGMSENAIKGPGVCAGMATANSMHVACEALGMALPGSAPVLANSPRMLAAARSSGERIVAMVNEDLKPRQILTAGAFRNAVAAVLAVSGSINCIKHLQATAVEAGVDVDVFRLFNDLGESVPVLSAVRPNGENTIEEFEAAGGARALLKQLEPLLDTSVLTVTGQTLAQNLRDVEVANPEVIRPIGRSFSDKAPIVILHGSLAPESAVVKLGLRGLDRKAYFSGPAVVYDSGADAMRAIEQGQIQRGSRAGCARHGAEGWSGYGGSCIVGGIRARFGGIAERCGICQRRPVVGAVQQGPDGGRSVAGGGRGRPVVAGAERRSNCHRRRCPDPGLIGWRGGTRATARPPGRAGTSRIERLSVDLSTHGTTHVHGRGADQASLSIES